MGGGIVSRYLGNINEIIPDFEFAQIYSYFNDLIESVPQRAKYSKVDIQKMTTYKEAKAKIAENIAANFSDGAANIQSAIDFLDTV